MNDVERPQLFDDHHLSRVMARRAWRKGMMESLHEICLERREFTSDDVFDRARDKGVLVHSWAVDLRAFGPLMTRACDRLGWCRKTNRTVPARRSHAEPSHVWESLIWERPRLREEV